MERTDRILRSAFVVVAIVIVGWSFASVGCCLDTLSQLRADELKRTIEDPDWDNLLRGNIEDPDWDSVR